MTRVEDAIKYMLEMVQGIDHVFGSEFDSATDLQHSAAAIELVGLFFSKIKSDHAKHFFELGQALADLDSGSHPPILEVPKKKSTPNTTQIELAKAEVALALEAKIKAGKNARIAARELVHKFPNIKALAGGKSRHNGTWEETIMEWRKSLSAPSRKKNSFAEIVFSEGREVIERLSKAGQKDKVEAMGRDCAQRASEVGVSRGRSFTL